MSKNENVAIISSALFTAVAFGHFLRIVTGASLTIGGVEISVWASVIVVIVTATLAVLNCRTLGRPTKVHWLKWFEWLFVFDALVCFYSWVTGLSYWGFSTTAFGWIVLFDVVVIIILNYYAKKASSQMMTQ